jgi:peptide/nickel transport system substrate-binding protein
MGTLDADAGQGGLQPATQAKVLLDAGLKAHADEPTTGFVQYAAMSTAVPPFDNLHCRRTSSSTRTTARGT